MEGGLRGLLRLRQMTKHMFNIYNGNKHVYIYPIRSAVCSLQSVYGRQQNMFMFMFMLAKKVIR